MPEENTQAEEYHFDEKKQREAFALINLRDPFIRKVTAASLGGQENYGKIFSNLYKRSIQDPSIDNTLAYKQAVDPYLLSDDGKSTNQTKFKADVVKLAQGAVLNLSVAEAVKGAGSEEKITSNYEGKYVNELSEEEVKNISNIYMINLINTEASLELSRQNKLNAGGLEQIFCGKQIETALPLAA